MPKLLALALALSLLAAPARAASGSLSFVDGKVTAVRGGKAEPAKVGLSLGPGDSVSTSSGATAILKLEDGTVLKLRASSTVVLSEEGKSKSLTEIFLKIGSLFTKVVPGKGREFRLRTPAAVAAVRGTVFFTAYGREARLGRRARKALKARKGRDLWLCVGNGAVEVESVTEGDKRTVKEGEGILIHAGGDLTKPQAYDWTKDLNWNMDPAKGAVEDKTELDSAYSDLLDQDYK